MPVTTSARIGRWSISTWCEPSQPGKSSLDDIVIAVVDGKVRLGVFDGAENVLVPQSEMHTASAVATTRMFASRVSDPVEALIQASHRLHDPSLWPRHRNPLTAVALADLNPQHSGVSAVRAADCEVWAKSHSGVWTSLFPGDMLTSAGRQVWSSRPTPGSLAEGWAQQEALLDDEELWNTEYVGLSEAPRLESANLADAVEVIVSTDGARLTPTACQNIVTWLAEDLQRCPDDWPHASPHGDVAVLHAQLT